MTPRAVKRNISLRYCTKQLQPEDPKRSAQAKAKASPPAAPVRWASRAAAGALGPAGTQGGPEVMMQGFESAEVEVESLTRGALSWCGMRGSMHAPRVGCLARERAASSCREGAACFKAPHLPLLDRVVSDRVDARQQLHHNRVHLLARLAAVYRSMGGGKGVKALDKVLCKAECRQGTQLPGRALQKACRFPTHPPESAERRCCLKTGCSPHAPPPPRPSPASSDSCCSRRSAASCFLADVVSGLAQLRT